jgi:hypothetical protein
LASGVSSLSLRSCESGGEKIGISGLTTQREWIIAVVRGFVSVYVDWAATEDQVRAAAAILPKPAEVLAVKVVAVADTFGCRIAVDLIGGFDEKRDGRRIARAYAAQLSEALGVPAFALHDLILAGRSEW